MVLMYISFIYGWYDMSCWYFKFTSICSISRFQQISYDITLS
jgi:hypothetical protein